MRMDGIDTSPNFYLVLPSYYSNGIHRMVYKIQDKATKEIIRQVPSEKDIVQLEALAALRNKVKAKLVPSK